MDEPGLAAQVAAWGRRYWWVVVTAVAVGTGLIWVTDLVEAWNRAGAWFGGKPEPVMCRYVVIDGYDRNHDFNHAVFKLGDHTFRMDSTDLWRAHVVVLKGFDPRPIPFTVSMTPEHGEAVDYAGSVQLGLGSHFRLRWPQRADTFPRTATEVSFEPVGESEAALAAGDYWARRATCRTAPLGVTVTV